MIVFNLICLECEYSFEGWFDNTKAFNKQKKQKLIICPNCEHSNIKKALVAPNLSKKSNSKTTKNKKTLASNIKKIKKIVEENFDYVGESFSEEAKKMLVKIISEISWHRDGLILKPTHPVGGPSSTTSSMMRRR